MSSTSFINEILGKYKNFPEIPNEDDDNKTWENYFENMIKYIKVDNYGNFRYYLDMLVAMSETLKNYSLITGEILQMMGEWLMECHDTNEKMTYINGIAVEGTHYGTNIFPFSTAVIEKNLKYAKQDTMERMIALAFVIEFIKNLPKNA